MDRPSAGWLSWTLSALFAVGFFLVFSREVGFPYFYHPDEVNKVLQIVEGRRDFHHPLLMLNSASAVHALAGGPENLQQTVVIGRLVNVMFGALAVGLFCLAAGMLAGPAASAACGIVLCLDWRFIELAHYLKEEMALSFGLGFFCVAAIAFARRPAWHTSLLLGLGCAFAVSAKYVGAVCIPFAVILLLDRRDRNWRLPGIFLATLIVVILAINFQAWTGGGDLSHGIKREADLFESTGNSIPNLKALRFIAGELSPFGWFAIALFASLPWLLRIRPVPAHAVLTALPIVTALLLLLSTRMAGRYLLPLTLFIALQAAVVIGWLVACIPLRAEPVRSATAIALGMLGALAFQWPQLAEAREMFLGFHTDNRMRLAKFIEANLPPDAVIAEDKDVKIPGAHERTRRLDDFLLSQQIMAPAFGKRLDSMGGLETLRKQGVTHVIVFTDSKTRKALDSGAGFWGELTRTSRVLWDCKGGTPGELQPPLRLYDIRTASP